jgi:MoaA/NifB/PqqE/SkfB family radical SAM enzyme
MANLGNIIPMFSLEGWRERTDTRRGEGVFDKVMHAMDGLFEAGVIYGTSLTATRENAEEILSEDFIDYLFTEKHVLISWIFQYMPIGRSYTLDLMPTPQQRLWMWNQSWQYIREKHYFLADFWNHGTAVDGCLSAGGHGNGGYLYIEWNGNVTPCVFVPFSPVNVNTIFANHGTLNDIYSEPFFVDIRQWQHTCKGKNLLNPCLIRDHNHVLRELIGKHEPDPIDPNAAAAIQDMDYAAGLDKYSKEYQQIADQVWEKVYIENTPLKPEEVEDLIQSHPAENRKEVIS